MTFKDRHQGQHHRPVAPSATGPWRPVSPVTAPVTPRGAAGRGAARGPPRAGGAALGRGPGGGGGGGPGPPGPPAGRGSGSGAGRRPHQPRPPAPAPATPTPPPRPPRRPRA